MIKTKTGYSEKLQSSRQSRPSSRAVTRKRTNSKSVSSNDSSRASATGYTQTKQKHTNGRSQSLPARPPTRRKPTDMPNSVENTSGSHISSPSGRHINRQKSRSARSQHYINKPPPDYAYLSASLKQPVQDVIIVDYDVVAQMNTSLPVEKYTPQPAPRKQQSKKHDTSYKKSITEHEYLQFSLRITEDIIRNDLYTNEEMRRVFNSHIEANRGRLDMDKMNKQIQHLCLELNIPNDDVPNTDVPTRSQIQTTNQNRKTCICGPLMNPPPTNLEGCECGSIRCIPLSCTQHHKSTAENVVKSSMTSETNSEQRKFENVSSSPDEEVIETNYFEKPESVSQASIELYDSIFDADNPFNASNDRSSPMKDYVQLPSLSCVTELTEPSTSASTMKSTVAPLDVNAEIASEHEQAEATFENLEIARSNSNCKLAKSSFSKRSSVTSKKSIGFGNDYVKVLTSEIHVEDLDIGDDDDSSISRSYMEALELNRGSDKKLTLSSVTSKSLSSMDLDDHNENAVGLTCCCHSPCHLVSTGKVLELAEYCTICMHSTEVQCSLVEVLSKEDEVKHMCIQPPQQIISEQLSSFKDQESVAESVADKCKSVLVNSNCSESESNEKTNAETQAPVQIVKSTLLTPSALTVPSNFNNPSASSNQPTLQSVVPTNKVETNMRGKSNSDARNLPEAVPVCQRSHSSQFEVLELLEPSNIKVRRSNNEEETFVLFPGCIYIPKVKLNNVVAPASITPLRTPSSFSKDADTNTDIGQLNHAAALDSAKLNEPSAESVLSAKSNQLYCNERAESISSDTLASFTTKSSCPPSTSKESEQSDKACANSAPSTSATQKTYSKITSNKPNPPESQTAKEILSSHVLASIAENLNKISAGIAGKGESVKTSPVSNNSNQLESLVPPPAVLTTEEQNASTLNQQSFKSNEQSSSLSTPAMIAMGTNEPSVEIAEQNLDLNTAPSTSKVSSQANASKEQRMSVCSTEPCNSCSFSNAPDQNARLPNSYSTIHASALNSIHYNSFVSSISKLSEIPQQNSLPTSKVFIENLNIAGPPKILMQNNSEEYRHRNPSSISGYETMDFSSPSRLLIEQLNDYDLTPQRDNNSGRSGNQTTLQFPYSNCLQSGTGLQDGLLLGDEYEIKSSIEKSPSDSSRYDNCLPRAICKFYPNSSTQTDPSDWVTVPQPARRQSQSEWNHFVKPAPFGFSGSVGREDGFKRSFELMFEKQEAERFQLQMEKALEDKLQHIESLNDAHRKSFDSVISDNTHMNFFMVEGDDRMMSRDRLDTLNTTTDAYVNVVEPKKGSREKNMSRTPSARLDIGHSRDNKSSRENASNVNVSESKASVIKTKLMSSKASYGSVKASKDKKINRNSSESGDKSSTQKPDPSRVDHTDDHEKRQGAEEETEADLFQSLDDTPSFIRRPSMMLTIAQVTSNLKKLRKGNSMDRQRSSHMQTTESEPQGSHDSIRRHSESVEVPFIEVKPGSDTDLTTEEKGSKDEHVTCCGLKKAKKKARRDIVDVDESVHMIPNVSAITDEQLYMIDVRRPTNTGYGADRKSLRFDYSALKDFNKHIDTELDESNNYDDDLAASNDMLPTPRKPVITYGSLSYEGMTREQKVHSIAPFHSNRNDSTETNDSVVDILSGPPSPSTESLILETPDNFRRKSIAQRNRTSTDSSDRD